MRQTVVSGIDRSDAAAAVTDTASWLASALDMRLLVVHAVEEPVEEAQELLESMRARLASADDADMRLVRAAFLGVRRNDARHVGDAAGGRGLRACRARAGRAGQRAAHDGHMTRPRPSLNRFVGGALTAAGHDDG